MCTQPCRYPHYIGLDVSKTIHEKTSKRFKGDDTKEFRLYNGKPVIGLKEDCTLSFDVIYHLVEDEVFHNYMAALFAASTKYELLPIHPRATSALPCYTLSNETLPPFCCQMSIYF